MKKKLEELALEKSRLLTRDSVVTGDNNIGQHSEIGDYLQSLGITEKAIPPDMHFKAVEYFCGGGSSCDY